MKKKLTLAATLVGLFCSLQAQASTTWIPISVGDISIIIPYTPSGLFLAPANANISTVSGVSTLSWSDVEHASKYQVQALNAQGQWVTIATTESLFLVLTGSNANYSSFRVVACNYNTCASTGSWSEIAQIQMPVTLEYTYDALGRLKVVTDTKNGNRNYTYDKAGNRITAGNTGETY